MKLSRPATDDEITAMAALEACKRIQDKRDKWATNEFVSLSRLITTPIMITDNQASTLWRLVWKYRKQVRHKRSVLLAKFQIEGTKEPELSPGDAEKLRRWQEATE